MKTLHKIIVGDSREMISVKNASVDLVVTSPPYWQLKDYGVGRQIGYNDSYEDYINNLNLVWNESYRVLKPGCRLCVNIGDQFARSSVYGRYKIIPIRTEIVKFCETIGFDYMGAVIWQKVTTTKPSGGAVIMGSYPYPRNGILKLDYEFILIFKKEGVSEKVSEEIKEKSKLSNEEWNQFFSGHWNFPGEKQNKHLAIFPIELPDRLIKMFSFIGDTVLDPFIGSGTTAVSAKNLNRNSIGIEINEKFLPVIKNKLDFYEPNLFHEVEITFEHHNLEKRDFDKKISALPYVFKDPHKLDKKTRLKEQARRLRTDVKRETEIEYYTVKEILGPNLIQIDNGKKVKILGVRIKAKKKEEAILFLRSKTKSQKVMIKFDQNKYDNKRNWQGYVYLKNKTFLNAHLIKAGLAHADKSNNYKYRDRFKLYEDQIKSKIAENIV